MAPTSLLPPSSSIYIIRCKRNAVVNSSERKIEKKEKLSKCLYINELQRFCLANEQLYLANEQGWVVNKQG